MTKSHFKYRWFSYTILLYLFIKLSALILSRTTLRVLELYISNDAAGSIFWVIARVIPSLEPVVALLDYIIIFSFCIVATPKLVQASELERIFNPSSLRFIALSGISYLTFIFSIWFGRAPYFLEDLGMQHRILVILVMYTSTFFVILFPPFMFGVSEGDDFGIEIFDPLKFRQLIGYSVLFAAGMALILRLGGILEIALLIYLSFKLLSKSQKWDIDLERSILNLLYGINYGSKRFAVGFLILTGVYLGTQTLIHVRLQLTFIYTIFQSNVGFSTIGLFLSGLGISIFFAAVVPMWWLQRPKSVEDFNKIVILYLVLLLQLISQFVLSTYVETVPDTTGLTLQNPSVFAVLLAGTVVGYAYLRGEISSKVGSSIFALIAIILLWRILSDYPVMTDVEVLAWCALSYWAPPSMRYVGRKFGFLLNII